MWEQDIEGTPFAKILRSAALEIQLQGQNGSTVVTLAGSERLRGLSRLGSPMMRRAIRRRLNEALDGIERALNDSAKPRLGYVPAGSGATGAAGPHA